MKIATYASSWQRALLDGRSLAGSQARYVETTLATQQNHREDPLDSAIPPKMRYCIMTGSNMAWVLQIVSELIVAIEKGLRTQTSL